MKKKICFILALLMIGASASSCSDKNANETTQETPAVNDGVNPSGESETEPETKKFLDDLEESYDFGGYSMRFIVEEGGQGNLTELSIRAEEDTGEVVDSAVFERNNSLCERLGINIELVDVIGFPNLPGTVRPSIQANSDDYDIIGAYQYYSIGMGPEGLLMNLKEVDNIDVTREYWGTDYIDNMSYKDITYWVTGDIALRYTGGMYVTYINQEIWNNHYADTNIYDVVNEGKWTLDALNEYSNGAYEDVNGNGRLDFKDSYGFAFDIEDPAEGMAAGSMIKFSERDDSGVPKITLNNERTMTLL